jgi:diguanylate cyclase (GGDEF)-like protein
MTQVHGNALDRLAARVLDSLDAHVAVIDAGGTIVAVNRAWTSFGGENGAADSAGVGADYLAVCEKAAREGDEAARAMLRSCRGLLAGRDDRASIEYACHSPERQRWFVVHVTPFAHEGALYLALVHVDVTARMIAQEERMRSEHELRRTKVALEAANRDLQAVLAGEQVKARTDTLTGLANRRHFFDLAAHMVAESRRYGTPLSIVMFDIDHFKRLNDEYGHPAGDRVLQCVARMAREHLRVSDVVARYGGEEFVAALPHTSGEHALAAVEKLRARIPACGGPGVIDAGVTISAGVAEMAGPSEPLEELVRRADAALYEAKRAGRDRSRLAPPP